MGSIETVVGPSDDMLVSEPKLGRPRDLIEFELELARDRSLDDNFLALGMRRRRVQGGPGGRMPEGKAKGASEGGQASSGIRSVLPPKMAVVFLPL